MSRRGRPVGRRPAGVAWALGALLAAALAAAGAGAHTRSMSWSSWELAPPGPEGGREARVVVRVPQIELTRLGWGMIRAPRLAPARGRYLSERVRLEADGAPCPVVTPPQALRAPAERAVVAWRVACPPAGRLAIASTLLREQAPSHLHFARLRAPDAPVRERVLTHGDPRWELAAPEAPAGAAPAGSSLGSYLVLGVEHIATGVDHLVFLLGLLLLAARATEVVTVVTGFTVAHSLTLGLAALGHLRPDAAAVEALIGLSIALVAAENAWLLSGRGRAIPLGVCGALAALAALAAAGVGAVPAATLAGLALFGACYFGLLGRAERPARLRFAIAFGFGLVHGFGFAGVLAEGGLPRERALPALLGFNLGVEAGQLALVALVWPVLRGLARWRGGRLAGPVAELGTAGVAAAGVFWLVSRAYG